MGAQGAHCAGIRKSCGVKIGGGFLYRRKTTQTKSIGSEQSKTIFFCPGLGGAKGVCVVNSGKGWVPSRSTAAPGGGFSSRPRTQGDRGERLAISQKKTKNNGG